MSLKDRITKIIEYTKLTAAEFASEIEVQPSSISHITSGRNKPSLDFILKVKNRFPEIEWGWLMTGKGDMIHNTKKDTIPPPSSSSTLLNDLFSTAEEEAPLSKKDKFPAHSEDKILSQNTNEIRRDDSQPLAYSHISPLGEKAKIKRIVIFFENGLFESYEN